MNLGIRRFLGRVLLCGALASPFAPLPASAGPLGLPVGPIVRDTLGTVRDTLNKTTGAVTGAVDQTLSTVTRDLAGRPVDPAQFEQDDKGERIMRGVILAISLSDRGREAAETLDIDVGGREDLDALDLSVTRLKLPPGLTAVAALRAMRQADPQGTYDFDHIYDPSGAVTATIAPAAPPRLVAHDAIKIGMIDSGIEKSHPAFRDADLVTKTIAGDKTGPATEHGTAVASLLVGDDRDFHGALAGATLYAADVFGGTATGGAADDIARGIAWLVDKETPVINISITGPANAILQAAVRAALARGFVIVAAVGNDGPAVGVKYPAAYEGVVAVTSVDGRGHVQIDANRGAAIAFAARGVEVRAAALLGKYDTITGTSFASPIVAARFAEMLEQPDAALAANVLHALAAQARSPGGARDSVYGYGVLDAGAQPATASVAAH